MKLEKKIDCYYYDEVKREWVYNSSSCMFKRCVDFAQFMTNKFPSVRWKAQFAKK